MKTKDRLKIHWSRNLTGWSRTRSTQHPQLANACTSRRGLTRPRHRAHDHAGGPVLSGPRKIQRAFSIVNSSIFRRPHSINKADLIHGAVPVCKDVFQDTRKRSKFAEGVDRRFIVTTSEPSVPSFLWSALQSRKGYPRSCRRSRSSTTDNVEIYIKTTVPKINWWRARNLWNKRMDIIKDRGTVRSENARRPAAAARDKVIRYEKKNIILIPGNLDQRTDRALQPAHCAPSFGEGNSLCEGWPPARRRHKEHWDRGLSTSKSATSSIRNEDDPRLQTKNARLRTERKIHDRADVQGYEGIPGSAPQRARGQPADPRKIYMG